MIHDSKVRMFVFKIIGIFIIETGGFFSIITLGSFFVDAYPKSVEWMATGTLILLFLGVSAFTGRIANNLVERSYAQGKISDEHLVRMYGDSRKPNRLQHFTGPKFLRVTGGVRSGLIFLVMALLAILMIFGAPDDVLIRFIVGVVVIAGFLMSLAMLNIIEKYKFDH